MISIDNLRIQFKKSFFQPGEVVIWRVKIGGENDGISQVRVISTISYLDRNLAEIEKIMEYDGGGLTVEFSWIAPAAVPRGYGLDIQVQDSGKLVLASISSGFDVLEKWTQNPRYGFLTDYSPERTNIENVIQDLADWHINGLQFYDWMYRHEQFLTSQEPYPDILGRLLSRKTVERLIDTAHKFGMTAMPYTAVYGCSIEFYRQHPDWVIYDEKGKPTLFGENFMAIMDPRPETPWTAHLLHQFDDILTNTDFDGIHLDQYGDPKTGFTPEGNSFDLAPALAELINATHQRVNRHRSDGTVIFNAVGNWPIEKVAPADEDVVYIEVWPPDTSFKDLHRIITNAQMLGDGKPVILAVYVHPGESANPRLMDAVIFASGAGHIERGEDGAYLADPYFPKYEVLNPDQSQALHRYYEFAVRFQNLFGPVTVDLTAQDQEQVQITIDGYSSFPESMGNKILPIIRKSSEGLAISLVNLVGSSSGRWDEPVEMPDVLENLKISICGLDKKVRSVQAASPDKNNLELENIPFIQTENSLELTLPLLSIWSVLWIR